MKDMFQVMNEYAETFVNFLKTKSNDNVFEIEMKDALSRYCNDVIASTAFGTKVDSYKDYENYVYIMGKETANVSGFWKTLKILGYVMAPKVYIVSMVSTYY